MAAGICHTDLGIIDGYVPIGPLPLIPGHEVAGQIVEIGDKVSNDYVGKRVCVSYGLVCGNCEYCRKGNDTLCDAWQTMGRAVNGGFAEFMTAPVENMNILPDNVSYEIAAIIPCSVSTAYHAVKRAGIMPGQKATIIGVGGLGLNAVQFAVMDSLDVIAVDISDAKLDLAKSLGAVACINAQREDPVKRIKELTNGKGADATLEFVGSPAAYKTSVESVRKGGRVVIVGGYSQAVSFHPERLMAEEVTITGAHAANRNEVREVVALLGKEKIDLKKMVTHVVAFENILAGMERLRTQEGDPIRVVVRFPDNITEIEED